MKNQITIARFGATLGLTDEEIRGCRPEKVHGTPDLNLLREDGEQEPGTRMWIEAMERYAKGMGR